MGAGVLRDLGCFRPKSRAMTITRAVLLFLVAVLVVDYHFGNGRLFASISAQTAQLGYKLSDELSRLTRRVSPR
jgi:hypothetical protein